MSCKFLSKEDRDAIVAAIKEAELNTSGEIRVHVEPKCGADALERAVYVFNRLKMYRTTARNGVLVYVAYESRRFCIIGDKGINDLVAPDFWDDVRKVMGDSFANADFAGGIIAAIRMTGEKLKSFFPYTDDDVNEQPDDISFG